MLLTPPKLVLLLLLLAVSASSVRAQTSAAKSIYLVAGVDEDVGFSRFTSGKICSRAFEDGGCYAMPCWRAE